MSRGRTPRSAAILRRAVDRSTTFVEPLERRDLLTTLNGGDTFDYLDANDNVVRIRLIGNITAEFIAARVRGTDNSVVIRDLVPAPAPNATPAPDGADLFQIYVAAASPDAQILISAVPDITSPDTDATPFAGANTIRRTPMATVNATGGGVYIGARTVVIGGVAATGNIPIFFNPRRQALGVRPAGKPLFAGIQTAPGVSLGKVFIGGTVTGIVNIEGNIDTFYAANVLTGDANGLAVDGITRTSIANNFSIGGDLRNLIVGGSIGTVNGQSAPYRTGFDARIGGKLGWVHVGNDDAGSFEVINSPGVHGLTTPVQELETQVLNPATAGSLFLTGFLSGALLNNDNPGIAGNPPIIDNFQFTSSYTSSTTGTPQTIEFTGLVNAAGNNPDSTDTYGLPLLAGQTVSIRITTESTLFPPGLAGLGVIDPLGRLVATNLPDASGGGLEAPFQLTAKVPGVYRLVVAMPTDATFNGAGTLLYATTYKLSVANIGEVAVGGITVRNNSILTEPGIGIAVRRGDLGAWESGGEFGSLGGSLIPGFGSPVSIARGNLRALYANQIGNTDARNYGNEPGTFNLEPDLVVPRGSVGYVLSNGQMLMNPGASDNRGTPNPAAAIGGDYQRVEARGDMNANIVANGSIGTIIAGSISGSSLFFQPTFAADADGQGKRGTIDLIYVTGDLGTLATGGPSISTGRFGRVGNVKYMRVLGTTYRDRQVFGSSAFTNISLQPGESKVFTDDSGATALIAPTTVSVTNGTTTTTTIGALNVIYYGLRSGGGVIVSATSSTSMNVTSLNNRGSFDISELTTTNAGTPVTYNSTANIVGFTTAGIPSSQPASASNIILGGLAPVNVFNITGGSISNINNATSGEVASINATSVGYLAAQSAGFVKSNTNAEVNVPTNIAVGVFPYNPFSFGIEVTGSMIAANIREGVGDFHVGNALGTLTVNADGVNTRRVFDGVHGAVGARVIKTANIGEGVAATGTGAVVGGGIFAFGTNARLQQVIGVNADIRGYIAATGQIGAIRLINGSLIGAKVVTVTDIAQAVFTNNSYILFDESVQTTGADTGTGTTSGPPAGTVIGPGLGSPDFSIGTIQTTGTGGILGSRIIGGDLNAIDAQGFGIVGSRISTSSSLTPDNVIQAGGLGIRESSIDFGASINRISAIGSGKVLDVNGYSPTVRQSIRSHYDVLGNGRLLSVSSDLNRALGTSRARSKVSGLTNAGLITNSTITGNGTLNSLKAYLIGSAERAIPTTDIAYPMRISVANEIRSIEAAFISGLALQTGVLDSMSVQNILQEAAIEVAGHIGTIAVGRTMRGSTQIAASGPQGNIDTIFVKRGMFGSIISQSTINSISAGSLGATLNSSNNINSILVRGDILSTADIRARKRLGSLVVLGDIQTGAKIASQTHGVRTIGGVNNGTFITL